MAIIGIAMIAVSVYYLYAYMRSGSDADQFNVDAAAPEDQLAFLGQAMPKPRPRNFEAKSIDAVDPQSPDTGIAEALSDVDRLPVEINKAETVSITSVLPGAGVSVDENAVNQPVLSRSVAAETVLEDRQTLMVVPSSGKTAQGDDTIPELSSISSKELIETFASIYPGGNMNPRYWSDPYWAGNLPFGGKTIPDGFMPIDATATISEVTAGERGVRMRIPAIDLDATVSELEIKDLGDSREWSTPDKVVGHIPTTANPGEAANGWYFGHLEDFLSNEGDIFRRLPEIPSMIKNDPVDIFITTSDAEYLYRVTGTRQLHRDELSLTETNNAQITLVTCWPFRVYDQRIVVSAVLIAVKPLAEA